MAYPPVIVVDEHDKEIGAVMLTEVWEKGLYHRIARVMVEDASGRVLLQRRSSEMSLYPDRWDCSAGGHVDQGMSYDQAAIQEVGEELGIIDPDLNETGYFFMSADFEWRKMNNFNKLYTLRLDGQDIVFEEHEVSEVAWFEREELERLLKERPEEFTAGLRHILINYYHSSLYTGVQ
jgi:16S rRNA (adenine1518-N6/adenine1519-N6)-dimethyltransferase